MEPPENITAAIYTNNKHNKNNYTADYLSHTHTPIIITHTQEENTGARAVFLLCRTTKLIQEGSSFIYTSLNSKRNCLELMRVN